MSLAVEQERLVVQRDRGNRTLLAGVLATVLMLFTGFAAAYLERSANVAVWTKITLPSVLIANTILLLVSSVALEWARRRENASFAPAIALGALFLVGQVWAWVSLRNQGITTASNAHAAFFYILSALHALHLAGGLIALLVAVRRPRIRSFAATYWHCMGAVWLYVLGVLIVL